MSVTRRWALCALLFAATSALAQQDEIVLGPPLQAGPGEEVSVPVCLRDVDGTPSGSGGKDQIQEIDLSITNSHPHLVVGCLGTTYPNCDLQFEARGVLATTPLKTSDTLINIASLYVQRIFVRALHFTGGRDLIGFITFRLDPKAPLGTVIRLRFDPAKTFLKKYDGTRVDPGLTLTGANITIAATPTGGPTLDFAGLTILVILLAAAGLFAMNRLSIESHR